MSETQFHRQPEVPHYMSGEEMKKKATPLKARKRVQFRIEPKPLVDKESGENYESRNINSTCPSGHVHKNKPSGTRVKVLMTKVEAARLLAKCKDGGVLEFKDVALELVQIPYNRVNIGSSHSS